MFESEPGIELHYEVAGDGTETLIVPNAGVLPDMEPLARDRRLVELHVRGRGASEPLTDPQRHGLSREAGDIVALADHLGLGTFALLGWSYAGFVAALCAAEHPDRVSRLVLMCARPPYQDPKWPAPSPSPDVVAELERLRESPLRIVDPEAYCREFWGIVRRARMGDPAHADRLRADQCRWPNEWPERAGARMQMVLRADGDLDLRPSLARVTAPALVVHGDTDMIPLAGSETYARLLPNARLLRIPGVGHYPHLERPDVFFPAVDAFLREGG